MMCGEASVCFTRECERPAEAQLHVITHAVKRFIQVLGKKTHKPTVTR